METVTLSTALKELLPTVDSLENEQSCDVIGNKADTYEGNSILALLKCLINIFHSSVKVYPTLTDGITIASGAGAWELGDETEIIPEGTITDDFSLHFVNIEAVSDNAVYEIVFYNSGELTRERFAKISNQTGVPGVPLRCPIQIAGTAISAKLACSIGGAETVTVSISYHTH